MFLIAWMGFPHVLFMTISHPHIQLDALRGKLSVLNHLGIKTDFDLANYATMWKNRI